MDPERERPVDRAAYLEEQIQRQKRGEPIDVEWVRAELERARREQAVLRARMGRTRALLAVFTIALAVVLWLRNGGASQHGATVVLGGILVAVLATWSLARRKS
jgi:hypothetical protein